MRKTSLILTTSLILLSSYAANAALNMGGQTVFDGTVIEVLEPGSAKQIQGIITNITDASDSNPYLILLGPGVYDLGNTQIVMKQWVSIQGSGQESTKITGAVSTSSRTTSAVVRGVTTAIGVNNADLTDLTIENTGGGNLSIAILNEGSNPRIERVTATASGADNNYGIWNIGYSSPIMTNVTAEGLDGTTNNYGVLNVQDSSPMMTDCIATASSSGGSSNSGVFNDSSSPTMINVTASASGAMHNNGVFNLTGSSPTITNVIASATGGTYNYGVNSSDNASPYIQNSILEGETFGVFISENSPGTRIVNSKIVGGIYNEASGTQCRENYDSNLLDVFCELPPKPPAPN